MTRARERGGGVVVARLAAPRLRRNGPAEGIKARPDASMDGDTNHAQSLAFNPARHGRPCGAIPWCGSRVLGQPPKCMKKGASSHHEGETGKEGRGLATKTRHECRHNASMEREPDRQKANARPAAKFHGQLAVNGRGQGQELCGVAKTKTGGRKQT